MNRTIHFAKLDYLTIKPYMTFKNLIIIVIVMIFFGYSSGPAMPIGMLMMYSTIYASYPFAVGDKNGIDTLYATLPITRKSIVTGRYIFTISLNLITGLASFALSYLMATIFKKEFIMVEILGTLLLCFAIFTIFEFVQLPIFFKLGYAKAKFLAYLPLLAFSGIVMAVFTMIGKETIVPLTLNIINWIGQNLLLAILIALTIWFILLLTSIMISDKCYNKREF